MAEIDIQQKRRSSWPIWVLGMLALILLIWWVWPDAETEPIAIEDDLATEVQPATVPPPEPIAQAEGIPVSQIIESPATWTGQSLSGEVRVTEVPTDRGFWIEDQGERLFVVINPVGDEQPNIQANTTISLREATVRDATFIGNLPGQIDQDTRNILQSQSVFLTVEPGNIEMNVGM